MAITVTEKWESRASTEGKNPTVDLVAIVEGTDDDLAAKAALAAWLPDRYDGLALADYKLQRIGQEEWLGTGLYDRLEHQEVGDSTYNFETGGGTEHITQSLETVGTYAAAGETAPAFGGAIGVNGQGEVEGVDIHAAQFSFSETHIIDADTVTEAYINGLFDTTDKVNAVPFRGMAAGQVLFLGATGSKRSEEDWEITFKFACSPNARNLVIGGITGIDKDGWDYLWVYYREAEDAEASRVIPQPIAVYVERVYYRAPFTALGI